MNIVDDTDNKTVSSNIAAPVLKVIQKPKRNPRVLRIKKKNMKNNNMSLNFKFVTDERVMREVNNLNPRKANQDNYIPTKIIKESKIIFSHFLYHNVDNFLQFLFFHLA